jgi:hypothetical protein
MAGHNDATKEIWLTEFGWPGTLDPSGHGIYCDPNSQASRLSVAFSQKNVPPQVGQEFWWLTDRKHFGGTCHTSWVCDTPLLTDRLGIPSYTRNPYTAFKNAP